VQSFLFFFEQADLLELQLLDVLAQALLKDPENLLSSALTPIHSLAKGLLKLAAQAQDEVHHATPAGHWGSPHAAQLLLQTGNTCMHATVGMSTSGHADTGWCLVMCCQLPERQGKHAAVTTMWAPCWGTSNPT
jgi:hypothetical protein